MHFCCVSKSIKLCLQALFGCMYCKPKAGLKAFVAAGLNSLTSKYGNSTQQIVQYVAYTVDQEKAGLAVGVFSIFI